MIACPCNPWEETLPSFQPLSRTSRDVGTKKKKRKEKVTHNSFPDQETAKLQYPCSFSVPRLRHPAGFRVEHGLEDNEALRLVRKEVRTVPGSVLRTRRFVVKCRGCVCFLT